MAAWLAIMAAPASLQAIDTVTIHPLCQPGPALAIGSHVPSKPSPVLLLVLLGLALGLPLLLAATAGARPGTETAAQALVRYLEQEGVTKVFGVPGEETLHIVDAIRRSKRVQFVLAGNEQGASLMATGYARATGKMGVALSTLGPGATNLVTGTANALSENLQLLVITGQGPVKRPVGYHQKLDLTRLFKPVTRLSLEAQQPRAVVPTARKLVAAAKKNPGPVHLSLPADVAALRIPVAPTPGRVPKPRRPKPTPEAVARAARLIKQASFPVLVAGDGVLQESAGHNARGILAFARAHGIPVVPSTIAKGMFPWSSKEVLPPLGPFAKGRGADVVRRADLILTVGYHPTETFDPATFNRGDRAKVVHLSTQKLPRAHRVSGMRPTVALTSGLVTGLGALHRQLKGYRAPQAVADATRSARAEQDTELSRHMASKGKAPIKPQQVMGELRLALDRVEKRSKGKSKVMVFGDVGLNKAAVTQWLQVRRPGDVVLPNGMSTMGVSLPAAVGAKVARPELKVVSVSGDGGLMMNVQELATAAKLKLPLVHVVLIDRRLGLIENHQRRNNLRPSGVDVPKLDVISLAKGMGAKGVMIKRASQIGREVHKALGRKRPTLIGIPVDYSQAQAAADQMGAALRKRTTRKPVTRKAKSRVPRPRRRR